MVLKVLIISHNPVSTYQNMGKTLLSLFSAMRREELCQLYIYPTIPNADVCCSYYRVTDKDILHSYWRFRVGGGQIACDQSFCRMFEHPQDERLYRNPGNKSPLRMMARDLMWKCARWYNADLKRWLDDEAPTCIFAAPGSAKFLYDIAERIARTRGIPIVTYTCDDYYFVAPEKTLPGKLCQALLKSRIRSFLKETTHLVTICDEMRVPYSEAFAVPATTLMTGSTMSAVVRETLEEPSVITYFGNIRGGRHHCLAEVGRALDRINASRRTEFRLKIYSPERNAAVLQVFSGISSVELCGFVTGEAYESAFRATDFLLHVEGFDVQSMDKVKFSFSTKIADSLASGIALIACGPAQVASMGHLLRNDCAFAAADLQMLEPVLLRAFTDGAERERIVRNALAAARRYHDGIRNSQILRQILEAAEGGESHE